MNRDSEKRMLMCKLTDAEHIDRGVEQAETYKAYCRVEAEKKGTNEGFKEQLDAARKELSRLSQICKTGYESRLVECRWIEDFEHNVKRLVRQDDGQVIDEQALAAEERQTTMLS
jgi:hypothetical protein